MARWRAAHWAAALAQQGVDGGNMALTLQECFDATRMKSFRFEPGVKVCPVARAPGKMDENAHAVHGVGVLHRALTLHSKLEDSCAP